MYWLQSPPWGRWLAVTLMVAMALWVEFRPEGTIEHPFATRPIAVGEDLSSENTEMRPVPVDLLEPIPADAVVTKPIAAGAPILVSDLGTSGSIVPRGWWVVELGIPAAARRGDRVRLVLVETGSVVDGVVASSVEADTFGSNLGTVAIAAENASEVATAAANGRVAVLVSTG